jgi:hypothetical protein
MGKISICCVGGIGDTLLGRQCGYFSERAGDEVSFFYPVREEIFRVIKYFFPDSIQIGEAFDSGNNFEKDITYRNQFRDLHLNKDYDQTIYWVVPDLLFANDHAFNYQAYNIEPQTIKTTKLLLDQRMPVENIIYCALATSTPNYEYPYLRYLLKDIADRLPEFIVYFPYVSSWSGKRLDFGDLKGLPGNVWVDENPDFLESIELMKKSRYGVCTCNGSSHLMYHLGIPRLILDPQFMRPAWVARWKENESECINRLTDPDTVAHIVATNLRLPQTMLLDRKYLLDKTADWKNVLMLKKY